VGERVVTYLPACLNEGPPVGQIPAGGPVTNLAVCALAGGGGILLMAAIEPRLRCS
jgi:hypothetical protein